MSVTALDHPHSRHRLVLAELIPANSLAAQVAREAGLVVGAALAMALFSQLVVPLWFTPVPISLGSLAVLFTGAALGPARGSAAVVLFGLAGVLGAPVFSQHQAGWALATFGYILAYLPAAALAGLLARRGADRSVGRMLLGVVAASVILYLGGVPWLMAWTGMPLGRAVELGVLPFILGDTVKAVVISLALPATWRVLRRG